MVNFPQNTPLSITDLCQRCKSNYDVVISLQRYPRIFIEFFKIATNDPLWRNENKACMENMVEHVGRLFTQEGLLDLPQARIIIQATKAVSDIFPAFKNLLNEGSVQIFVKEAGERVAFDRLLLCSASSYFTKALCGSFVESSQRTIILEDLTKNTLIAIKEFLETGKIEDITKLDLSELFEASRRCTIPSLTDYLSKSVISADNVYEMTQIAYTHKLDGLKRRCFSFINEQSELVTISSDFLNVRFVFSKLDKPPQIYSEITALKGYISLLSELTESENVRLWLIFNGVDLKPQENFNAGMLFQMFPRVAHVKFVNLTSELDDTVEALCTHCLQLESINASYVKITDRSLRAILALPKLTALNLEGCRGITGRDITKVACLGLDELNLRLCDFTDEGIEVISNNLHNLTKLNLGDCTNITTAGLQRLSSLAKLSDLDLSRCTVTGPVLKSLSGLTQLTHLCLFRCIGLEKIALEEIRSHLPKLKVDVRYH